LPVVVFEVRSPSTALTDLRVKPEEYAAVATMLAYVILPHDAQEGATVLRRSGGWTPEVVARTLELPEIGISFSIGKLYGT
jgi:Uma2 family endonuclease